MTRSQRLLQLIQVLRRHTRPVKGADLAHNLGISLRTLYRDIATLQQQGTPIEGESGVGYVLKPGFTLPPLMFSSDEIEALVLGCRWVADRADPALAEAALEVLSKVAAILPAAKRLQMETSGLLVGPGHDDQWGSPETQHSLRLAIRDELKVHIGYSDADQRQSQRTIWPLGIGFFDHVRVLIAWCEWRNGFRHFRLDRIRSLERTDMRYPQHRMALLQRWREVHQISVQWPEGH